MTTYTPISRLAVMTPGDPSVKGSWGLVLNAALPLIEQNASGYVSIDLTGLNVLTLSVSNDAPDQARMAMLLFTGASTGTATVTVPAVARIGWVGNTSTHSVILTTGGGTPLTIPTATSYLYRCDGTNVSAVDVGHPGAVAFLGTVTLPNNVAYRGTDTGGTARNLLSIDGSNNTVLANGGGGTWRVRNQANTQDLISVTNAGAANFLGAGTFGGPVAGQYGTIPIGGGMDFFGPSAPAGWLFAAGQAVSRTTYAALFAVIGITFGAGNGSTTFNLPDKRGRISLPLDNLGGSAAGRVNVFAATSVGAAGGDQNLHLHSHGIADPTHNHTISQSPHAHVLTDPGHTHGVSDPTHSHPLPGAVIGASPGFAGGVSFGFVGNTTNAAATGIAIVGAGTGITLAADSAIVSNVGASTGIVVQNNGAGNAQNMPPVLVCTYIIYAAA